MIYVYIVYEKKRGEGHNERRNDRSNRGTWRICTRVYEWQLHPLGELLSEVSTTTVPLLKS